MKPAVMVVIGLVCVTPVFAQKVNERVELRKLNPDAQEFVYTWLNQNCGVEEQQRIEGRIKVLGPLLEPVFWEAYRLDPLKKPSRNYRGTSGSNTESDRIISKSLGIGWLVTTRLRNCSASRRNSTSNARPNSFWRATGPRH